MSRDKKNAQTRQARECFCLIRFKLCIIFLRACSFLLWAAFHKLNFGIPAQIKLVGIDRDIVGIARTLCHIIVVLCPLMFGKVVMHWPHLRLFSLMVSACIVFRVNFHRLLTPPPALSPYYITQPSAYNPLHC